jgi:hypothetical protein
MLVLYDYNYLIAKIHIIFQISKTICLFFYKIIQVTN